MDNQTLKKTGSCATNYQLSNNESYLHKESLRLQVQFFFKKYGCYCLLNFKMFDSLLKDKGKQLKILQSCNKPSLKKCLSQLRRLFVKVGHFWEKSKFFSKGNSRNWGYKSKGMLNDYLLEKTPTYEGLIDSFFLQLCQKLFIKSNPRN